LTTAICNQKKRMSRETHSNCFMVTVLLLLLATAEVLGDASLSLEKMQQKTQQFKHGQGAHERQESLN